MVNQGAKKRKEENRKHMTNLRRLIMASNVRLISTSESLVSLSLCRFFSSSNSILYFVDLLFYCLLCWTLWESLDDIVEIVRLRLFARCDLHD
ncbi:hypothetical protein ZIOFF_035935 [Zingiber officinale]|uniref:Uncharacterized protein n=1 Tax=Zingiber officinale TaxID=94328 RepID=A0A8J5L141_ZINOF|nr:hypothetical protein ZIOFF_035935 [Zingiber officinale]